jgi:hypothetical protein
MMTTTNESNLERRALDRHGVIVELDRSAAPVKDAWQMTLVARLRRARTALRRARRHAASAVRR